MYIDMASSMNKFIIPARKIYSRRGMGLWSGQKCSSLIDVHMTCSTIHLIQISLRMAELGNRSDIEAHFLTCVLCGGLKNLSIWSNRG
jgi:hypothetical protein